MAWFSRKKEPNLTDKKEAIQEKIISQDIQVDVMDKKFSEALGTLEQKIDTHTHDIKRLYEQGDALAQALELPDLEDEERERLHQELGIKQLLINWQAFKRRVEKVVGPDLAGFKDRLDRARMETRQKIEVGSQYKVSSDLGALEKDDIIKVEAIEGDKLIISTPQGKKATLAASIIAPNVQPVVSKEHIGGVSMTVKTLMSRFHGTHEPEKMDQAVKEYIKEGEEKNIRAIIERIMNSRPDISKELKAEIARDVEEKIRGIIDGRLQQEAQSKLMWDNIKRNLKWPALAGVGIVGAGLAGVSMGPLGVVGVMSAAKLASVRAGLSRQKRDLAKERQKHHQKIVKELSQEQLISPQTLAVIISQSVREHSSARIKELNSQLGENPDDNKAIFNLLPSYLESAVKYLESIGITDKEQLKVHSRALALSQLQAEQRAALQEKDLDQFRDKDSKLTSLGRKVHGAYSKMFGLGTAYADKAKTAERQEDAIANTALYVGVGAATSLTIRAMWHQVPALRIVMGALGGASLGAFFNRFLDKKESAKRKKELFNELRNLEEDINLSESKASLPETNDQYKEGRDPLPLDILDEKRVFLKSCLDISDHLNLGIEFTQRVKSLLGRIENLKTREYQNQTLRIAEEKDQGTKGELKEKAKKILQGLRNQEALEQNMEMEVTPAGDSYDLKDINGNKKTLPAGQKVVVTKIENKTITLSIDGQEEHFEEEVLNTYLDAGRLTVVMSDYREALIRDLTLNDAKTQSRRKKVVLGSALAFAALGAAGYIHSRLSEHLAPDEISETLSEVAPTDDIITDLREIIPSDINPENQERIISYLEYVKDNGVDSLRPDQVDISSDELFKVTRMGDSNSFLLEYRSDPSQDFSEVKYFLEDDIWQLEKEGLSVPGGAASEIPETTSSEEPSKEEVLEQIKADRPRISPEELEIEDRVEEGFDAVKVDDGSQWRLNTDDGISSLEYRNPNTDSWEQASGEIKKMGKALGLMDTGTGKITHVFKLKEDGSFDSISYFDDKGRMIIDDKLEPADDSVSGALFDVRHARPLAVLATRGDVGELGPFPDPESSPEIVTGFEFSDVYDSAEERNDLRYQLMNFDSRLDATRDFWQDHRAELTSEQKDELAEQARILNTERSEFLISVTNGEAFPVTPEESAREVYADQFNDLRQSFFPDLEVPAEVEEPLRLYHIEEVRDLYEAGKLDETIKQVQSDFINSHTPDEALKRFRILDDLSEKSGRFGHSHSTFRGIKQEDIYKLLTHLEQRGFSNEGLQELRDRIAVRSYGMLDSDFPGEQVPLHQRISEQFPGREPSSWQAERQRIIGEFRELKNDLKAQEAAGDIDSDSADEQISIAKSEMKEDLETLKNEVKELRSSGELSRFEARQVALGNFEEPIEAQYSDVFAIEAIRNHLHAGGDIMEYYQELQHMGTNDLKSLLGETRLELLALVDSGDYDPQEMFKMIEERAAIRAAYNQQMHNLHPDAVRGLDQTGYFSQRNFGAGGRGLELGLRDIPYREIKELSETCQQNPSKWKYVIESLRKEGYYPPKKFINLEEIL